MDVRDIFGAKAKEAFESNGHEVDLSDIEHMVLDDQKSVDLDKARNWMERAAVERITKIPSKQGKREIEQLALLAKYNAVHPDQGTVFISNGVAIFPNDNADRLGLKDIDAYIPIEHSNNWNIVFSLRDNSGEGGQQDRSFNEMLAYILEAPLKTSDIKTLLCIVVNGSFWMKQRANKYRNWETYMERPFSTTGILKRKASDRKCLVLSNDDLVASAGDNRSFHDIYIAGKYE